MTELKTTELKMPELKMPELKITALNSQPESDSPDSTYASSFIVFELAGATYAISSQVVKQMEMIEQMTLVPNTDPCIDGVVFSRGQMIPALNLRVRFGFEKIPYTIRTRLVVVCVAGRTVGLVVDSAREFIPIPETVIQPLPEAISEQSQQYLSGIAILNDRLILLLNIEALLNLESAIPVLAKT